MRFYTRAEAVGTPYPRTVMSNDTEHPEGAGGAGLGLPSFHEVESNGRGRRGFWRN